MVDVLEFNRNMGGEVYPAADAQRRPTLTSDSTPPGQRSSSKKCNGHFDLLGDVCHATYQAVLLQIEEPVRQLLRVSFKFSRLVQF